MDLFKMFSKKEEKSKNVAKERLKLVLVHDRADLSPKFLDMIKGDIIRVISQYADIDEEGLDIKLTRMKKDMDSSTISALVANIPILKVKDNH
ncbi:cell division topological specificity factor MinE [Tissierella praeacuta]|uniref:Cell division topological specificity factor n=1 Tax=Tissierella praeacuta DSM 18095 TaxID=1123404 RepID=A0A1M4S6M4_9FIRM|nr:cell division topological specificity factor MinE [Tissierella praeacuta]MBU5256745.1 cell division topological specificity factor MinE [Tissierella praeacuta]TCU71656.1 cell division topological specificity factor MinE [Tissierella praeacuta]SHE27830.1 cell division topological specificity factor MinE [Tissierella praeacuta DSM 18095]SUP00990.1 Cell division topological specificity factor [Tissierella praeacuta]